MFKEFYHIIRKAYYLLKYSSHSGLQYSNINELCFHIVKKEYPKAIKMYIEM